MGFFKRLFSADYRAAVAAEAAGDLELAAERYALAGQAEAAVRVHLARADRAGSRKGEITALRDAHHWSERGTDQRKSAARRLGKALLAQATAEGIATERDRERVREAATMLREGGDYLSSGAAYEQIEDDTGAAASYRAGGLVDQMEDALLREQARSEGARELKGAYADYEVAARGGDRDGAIAALRLCVAAADAKTEYRRLLDELEARLIASGKVVLSVRGRGRVTAYSGEKLLMGRDNLCDFVLRSGGISRQHAEIAIEGLGDEARFILADAGSRNGTRIGGLRVEGSVPLEGAGSFDLGDHCTVNYQIDAQPTRISLRVDAGLDRGAVLVAAPLGSLIDLREAGIAASIYFRDGRPMLQHPGEDIILSGEKIAHGDVQLIHADQVTVGGAEIEVL